MNEPNHQLIKQNLKWFYYPVINIDSMKRHWSVWSDLFKAFQKRHCWTDCVAPSDPAGSGQLLPPRLLPLRRLLQGSGRRSLHRRPPQQHLLRQRLQQVSSCTLVTILAADSHVHTVSFSSPLCRTFAPKCAACLQPILPTEVRMGLAAQYNYLPSAHTVLNVLTNCGLMCVCVCLRAVRRSCVSCPWTRTITSSVTSVR